MFYNSPGLVTRALGVEPGGHKVGLDSSSWHHYLCVLDQASQPVADLSFLIL